MRLIVDVGGTYLRAKLYKKKDLQKSFRVRSKDFLLVNYIDGIVKDYKGIKKIALSFAGQVKDGVILASPNIKTDKKDIAKYFKKKYNIDLYIQNDLSCAVLAEAKYFKTQNICAIYVGTGIGCGVVSGGRLVDGYMGVSTELGHIPYKESFFRCGCGKTNCLELFCSGVAIKKMRKYINIISISSFYETEPIGENATDNFINLVLEATTKLIPQQLLREIHKVEATIGRKRQKELHWGDRIIDIDIILYGNQTMSNHILTIPHAQYLKRLFVLVPLLEVFKDAIDPNTQTKVKDHLNDIFINQKITKIDNEIIRIGRHASNKL